MKYKYTKRTINVRRRKAKAHSNAVGGYLVRIKRLKKIIRWSSYLKENLLISRECSNI